MRKVVLSILVLVIGVSLLGAIRGFMAPIEAAVAVDQVNNSTATYAVRTIFIRSQWSGVAAWFVMAALLGLIWRTEIRAGVQKLRSLLPLAALLVLGCGPARVLPLEMVGPNETAFVIPLEGDTTAQAKFESVEFLNKHKVVSKRVELPVRERSVGRMWWEYEWIPTVRVVKVDRSLVTREWTTTVQDGHPIAVVSLDSINFKVGMNLTAFILEEDAAKYLYYHTTKPLAEVVDRNVRGYLQDKLSAEFGTRKLEDCKKERSAVIKQVEDITIKHFKEYGITISNIGSAGGFDYDDERIQKAINDTANAEMDIEVAKKEKAAQDERNKQLVAKATAEADAAAEFAKSAGAQTAKVRLEIERMNAEARLKWDGKYPEKTLVLPQGAGNVLLGLDH